MDLNLPHRRYNPLTREWVLVSPHRAQRPWLGQVEKAPQENLPDYDPTCYLCPRNARAGEQRNPDYTSTFVFDNDFPALLLPEEEPLTGLTPHGSRLTFHDPLLVAEPEFGLCRVVCFSPRHDLSLPELSQAEVEAVVRAWIDQTSILADQGFVRYVQVFENKGAMMGASNPHPHSQVWATSHIPNEPARESIAVAEYLSQRGSCLLCDTLAAEKEAGERLVVANEHFTALVPFWAVWPFEVLLLSNRHFPALTGLEADEIASLADIIRRLTARYDNLFEISFPYSMGFHQAPVNGLEHAEWHLHAHYYPPLLRSATVRKFMVGFEMLASPQRDLTPEVAAQRLRSLSDRHYRRQI
jgi:UDPglucose--hexose-1-phosphate uridylyltransferase